MTELTVNKPTDQFIKLVRQGIECWVEAGKIVVEAMTKDPDFVDRVCDADPDMSPEFVLRFRQIGLRRIHPRLLLADGAGPRRLIRLDYETQYRYLSEPLSVVIASGEILKVDVRNLTSFQAAQVFSEDRIRSEAEQRAWLESQNLKQFKPVKKANLPYRIVGKALVVMEPCTLSRKDLSKLVIEMR